MGLSFHDNETTMAESSAGTKLDPGDTDSTLEAGRIVHQEHESGCDTIDFKGSNCIEEIERWLRIFLTSRTASLCYQCKSCVGGGRYRHRELEPHTIMNHLYHGESPRPSWCIFHLVGIQQRVVPAATNASAEPDGGFDWKIFIWKSFYLWDYYPVWMRQH